MNVQDHVVAGVLLTKRDTLLERSQAAHLLFMATTPSLPHAADTGDYALPTPAILKPRSVWTGKQVLVSINLLATS